MNPTPKGGGFHGRISVRLVNIVYFIKDYHFLSCFSFSPMVINGIHFTSACAAFQSFKTLDKGFRKFRFENADPFDAYHAGHQLDLRNDWDNIKEEILLKILRKKFSIPELRQKLLTVDFDIVAHNNKGDVFWGVDSETDCGENRLGKLLMRVCGEFQNASSAELSELLVSKGLRR